MDQLKKDIFEVVSRHLDVNNYKLFFFGSRIKGNNFVRSDIDIGIEGEKEIAPEVKILIDEELEKIPMLYKIDFIDFKQVSDKFKKEALKFCEPIN